MHPAPTLTLLLDQLAFPESPRWHEGALWFSDFYAREVRRLRLDGKCEVMAQLEDQPSGLGWTPDGRLLAVAMIGRRLLRRDGEGWAELADLSALAPFHCNDMVVDAQGRAYIGNFGFDLAARAEPQPTGLILVEPDGRCRVVADGLWFPNGAVITPDGCTLIVAESFASRLTAFDIAADGGLSGRRVWAGLPGKVSPDGICMDAEGAIWLASPVTREVVRVFEGGAVVQRIATPGQALACMLGGPDRRTLYILSGKVVLSPQESLRQRTGTIHAVQVEVAGVGRP